MRKSFHNAQLAPAVDSMKGKHPEPGGHIPRRNGSFSQDYETQVSAPGMKGSRQEAGNGLAQQREQHRLKARCGTSLRPSGDPKGTQCDGRRLCPHCAYLAGPSGVLCQAQESPTGMSVSADPPTHTDWLGIRGGGPS